MTPKEKALDIFDKMQMDFIYFASKEISKRNSLIAVDEILDELLEIVTVTSSKYIIKHINYYQEVKQEIEKL